MDDVLNDYTIRDLQIISSRILADHEATNTFIKQFKADHDSHQFYKNVIKWYVDKYNRFPEPEDKLSFHFTPGDGGLGDRFITVSSILFSITHLKCNAIVYVYSPDGIPCKNFYDTIDFYRFERPQYKIKTIHLDESISYSESRDLNLKDYHYKLYYTSLFIEGKYWPITFSKKEKQKICYMHYTGDQKQDDKIASPEDIKKFDALIEDFPNLDFIRLEDFNYYKNVEILSESHFIFATEGMWTHLSRAMNIDTVAFTTNININKEINKQGHFSSNKFEDCLLEFEKRCKKLQ